MMCIVVTSCDYSTTLWPFTSLRSVPWYCGRPQRCGLPSQCRVSDRIFCAIEPTITMLCWFITMLRLNHDVVESQWVYFTGICVVFTTSLILFRSGVVLQKCGMVFFHSVWIFWQAVLTSRTPEPSGVKNHVGHQNAGYVKNKKCSVLVASRTILDGNLMLNLTVWFFLAESQTLTRKFDLTVCNSQFGARIWNASRTALHFVRLCVRSFVRSPVE